MDEQCYERMDFLVEQVKWVGLMNNVRNAMLAIDNPLEYARLYLDGTMQMWIDAEDSLELW